MPPRVSEQTPLLGGNRSASRVPYFTKAREYCIFTLDVIITAPTYPTKLALSWLGFEPNYQPNPRDEFAIVVGFWSFFTIVFSFLALFLHIFIPFPFFTAAFFLYVSYIRILTAVYKFSGGRFVIRTIAAGIILFSLWYVVDLRAEFTPEDLPPLSNSSSSIRILDVWPAGKQWRIEADLRTVRLEDNPVFEALSYEWGDSRKSHSISVGGKRFRVTANLWSALHNVRHETVSRALWVDAISIDQTNLDEKSTQVPLMSIIYRRARNVLISLGKHTPPHWVQNSDPSTWTDASVTKRADQYWETTAFWLRQLMLEEYWSRCWIVQEIGSGVSIEVYADRKPIPWDRFVSLAMAFASKSPTSTLANRVLRFDALRKALYHDGKTYALGQLLETFKDSFCSVSLDKVLAFVGMAVDCPGECIPIDYAGGPAPLYESLIAFQNSTTHQNAVRAVEMVHFAALVRRLLTRQQAKLVKQYKKPGWVHQPETWSYYWCGDENINFCASSPEVLIFLPTMEFLSAPFSAASDLQVKSSIWIPDTAEAKEAWEPGPGRDLVGIRARGAIVGKVRELGPTHAEYLRSPNAPHKWSTRLSQVFPAEPDQRRARGLDARLSALLGPMADYRLANVVNLPSQYETSNASGGPRLFIGGDDVILGLAPSNTRVGDILCQFWNSSAVAILRSRDSSSGYEIVGRGAMLQYGEEIDWDVPVNKTMFLPDSPVSTGFSLDLVTLNYLSFDTVNLLGAEQS